jgi:hypothetical protein
MLEVVQQQLGAYMNERTKIRIKLSWPMLKVLRSESHQASIGSTMRPLNSKRLSFLDRE